MIHMKTREAFSLLFVGVATLRVVMLTTLTL